MRENRGRSVRRSAPSSNIRRRDRDASKFIQFSSKLFIREAGDTTCISARTSSITARHSRFGVSS